MPLKALIDGNEWISNVTRLDSTKRDDGTLQLVRHQDQNLVGSEFPKFISTEARFDYHMRYQPCKSGGGYTQVRVADNLEVYFDCSDSELVTFNPTFRRTVMPFHEPLSNLLLQQQADGSRVFKGPKPLLTEMPVGDSDHADLVQWQTVGLTLLGMAFLLKEITAKSSEPVSEHSDFNKEKVKEQ